MLFKRLWLKVKRQCQALRTGESAQRVPRVLDPTHHRPGNIREFQLIQQTDEQRDLHSHTVSTRLVEPLHPHSAQVTRPFILNTNTYLPLLLALRKISFLSVVGKEHPTPNTGRKKHSSTNLRQQTSPRIVPCVYSSLHHTQPPSPYFHNRYRNSPPPPGKPRKKPCAFPSTPLL